MVKVVLFYDSWWDIAGWKSKTVGSIPPATSTTNILGGIDPTDYKVNYCHPSGLNTCILSKKLFSGPLFLQPAPGKFTQIGIVSWGFGCADVTPGVYANVANLVPWIQRIVAYY